MDEKEREYYESGKAVRSDADLSVMEEAGVGFDPNTQHLDLTKDEKRHTTALMMAIQAYKELIIREAAYLETVADLARRGEGPAIRPATIDAMVVAAIKFDCFISGSVVPTGEIALTDEADPDDEPSGDRGAMTEEQSDEGTDD